MPEHDSVTVVLRADTRPLKAETERALLALIMAALRAFSAQVCSSEAVDD